MPVVHVVEDFVKWFLETYPLDIPDADKLKLIESHWNAFHMNANELASLASSLNNPNALLQYPFANTHDRNFVSADYATKNSLNSCGVLRKRTKVENTVVDLITSKFTGLYDVEWWEEFGMFPLDDDTFLCRTIQRSISMRSAGQSPYLCLLFPSELAHKVLHYPSNFGLSLYGGYTLRVQAKPVSVPPELAMLDSDVQHALKVSAIKNKK